MSEKSNEDQQCLRRIPRCLPFVCGSVENQNMSAQTAEKADLCAFLHDKEDSEMVRSKWQWLLMAVLLAVTSVISACSGQGEKIKLSEMDDNALIAYLEAGEVTVPEDI